MNYLNCRLSGAILAGVALLSGAKTLAQEKLPAFFQHNVTTEKKPWTHLNFGNRGGEDFCFAIVADRTGRPRDGVFAKAIEHINRMRPEFVMSVGDYINGFNNEDKSEAFLEKQWSLFLPMVRKCVPPFFFIVGNHDCVYPCKQYQELHDLQEKIWLRHFGVTNYHFIYKNTLFLCLNSMAEEWGGIGKQQAEDAIRTLKQYPNVRWTFVFFHHPMAWRKESFLMLEKALYDRNYTVIVGDLHRYTKFVRNGRKYFMLGVTGGGADDPVTGLRGVPYGEFDHITWVSMCGNKPEFTNIALEGMHDENVVTTGKITWLLANYFHADKKIPEDELKKLRAKGIYAENPQMELSDSSELQEEEK